MQKLYSLLNAQTTKPDDALKRLSAQAAQQQRLQTFWQAAAPKELASYVWAGSLHEGHLTLLAHSAAAAAKLKLVSASLLIQLQNLQKTEQNYRDYKVTAISVKVQVKSSQNSAQKPVKSKPKLVPQHAAASLTQLAETIENPALARLLKSLASKSTTKPNPQK